MVRTSTTPTDAAVCSPASASTAIPPTASTSRSIRCASCSKASSRSKRWSRSRGASLGTRCACSPATSRSVAGRPRTPALLTDRGHTDRPAASPWRLGGRSVWHLVQRVYRRVCEGEILDRAAGLSYYFVFALLPTLLFLTALVGLLPLPDLMSRLLRSEEHTSELQ